MSLSEHEKTQFELLTAGLDLGGSVALKKMEKRDKAIAMSYVALPSRNTVLMIAALFNVGLFVSGVITRDAILTNATGAFGLLLTAALVINSSNGTPAIKPKTQGGNLNNFVQKMTKRKNRNMVLMVLALVGVVVSGVGLMADSTEQISHNVILLSTFFISSVLLLATAFLITVGNPFASNQNEER